MIEQILTVVFFALFMGAIYASLILEDSADAPAEEANRIKLRQQALTRSPDDFLARLEESHAKNQVLNLSHFGLHKQPGGNYKGIIKGSHVVIQRLHRQKRNLIQIEMTKTELSPLSFEIAVSGTTSDRAHTIRHGQMKHATHGALKIAATDLTQLTDILKQPQIEVQLFKLDTMFPLLIIQTLGRKLVARFEGDIEHEPRKLEQLVQLLTAINQELHAQEVKKRPVAQKQ